MFFRIVSSDKPTIVAQVQEAAIGGGAETVAKKMGRKKIQISRIADERNRQVRKKIENLKI